MRTVSIRQIDMKRAVIPLGFEGENEFTTVRIDCKKTFDEHPTAIPSLAVTDPAGNQYPAVIVRDGNYVEWTVTASDLTTRGDGEIQIIFTVDDDIIGKTDPAKTRINRSITPSGQVPSGVQNFIQQAGTILQEVENAIPPSGTTGQVLAKKSDADYDLEWVDQSGGGGGGTSNYNELSNKPQIGGVTLSGNKTLHDLGAAAEGDIPDVSGFYTKPQTGIPASDIADGVIPDVSGFYTKPGTGIPSSDLESDVQTAIGNANSAYQKPGSGIPVSDLASGVIPDVTGKADKVSGGTENNFAALDANGNIKDSGKKASDFLTSHQDISGKADKVASATNGNFAGLDSNGNLTDSGKKASDFATPADVNAKYTKPSGGIPASDIASGVIPVLTDLIDDTAGDGDTNKVWSADKSADVNTSLLSAIGMNGTEVSAGTGNPVTVRQIGATASVTSEAAKYMMCGKNLFSAGNQTVSVFKSVALPCKFPAGKYSITCVATSTDTDSDVCTINLFNGSTAAATGKSLHRGTREGATFTATTEFDNIYFYASNNFAHSSGDTATFTDIQLEAGEDKTDFDEYRGVIKNVSESILLEHEAETFYSVTGESLSVSYMQVDPDSIE